MIRVLGSLLLGGCLSIAAAGTGSIGVVRSSGDFRVDGSMVRGNGTLFEGDTVETTIARSVVQLNAVQITLGPDSRAKVYRDRTVLEKGAGLLRDADKHVFEAASLRIAPSAADSVIQVDVEGPGRISVSARSGGALVSNSGGVLVASLRAGSALEFDTQAGASAAAKLSGTVEARGGNYFLTDDTSKVTVQLTGTDLAKYVGKRVKVTGSSIPGAAPASGATQVVQVATISLAAAVAAAAGAGAGAGAAAAGAGAGAAAAAGAGIGVGTVAVVGGVAVAATVGGLAAAGTFTTASPTSVP